MRCFERLTVRCLLHDDAELRRELEAADEMMDTATTQQARKETEIYMEQILDDIDAIERKLIVIQKRMVQRSAQANPEGPSPVEGLDPAHPRVL